MKEFNISPFSSAQAYSGLNKAKKTEQAPQTPKTEKTDATPKTTTELGDELLTYNNFYDYMGLNISSSDGGVKKSTPYTPEQADMYAKMTTSPFMAALGDLTGIENNNDFNNVAMSYVKGVDPDKLSRYLEKPLGNSTVEGVNALLV